MGYKVQEMDWMRENYGPREGLEGPFNFGGRVLYYDVKEGAYYDPTTDFYVSNEEMNMIHERMLGARGWRG